MLTFKVCPLSKIADLTLILKEKYPEISMSRILILKIVKKYKILNNFKHNLMIIIYDYVSAGTITFVKTLRS